MRVYFYTEKKGYILQTFLKCIIKEHRKKNNQSTYSLYLTATPELFLSYFEKSNFSLTLDLWKLDRIRYSMSNRNTCLVT